MKKRLLTTIPGFIIGILFILLANYMFDLGVDPLSVGVVATTVLLLSIFASPWLERKSQESEPKSTSSLIIRVVIFIIIIAFFIGGIIFIGEALNLNS